MAHVFLESQGFLYAVKICKVLDALEVRIA